MSWLAKNNPCVPFLSFCKSGSGRLVVLWKRPHEWSTSFAHTVSLPNPGSPTHPGLGKLCDQAQKQVDDLFSFWINVASPHGWLEKSSRRLMMKAPDPLTPNLLPSPSYADASQICMIHCWAEPAQSPLPEGQAQLHAIMLTQMRNRPFHFMCMIQWRLGS